MKNRTLLALILLPSLALAVAPPNDNFAKAQALAGTEGTEASTNVGATLEGKIQEPNRYNDNLGNTVWYSFTAPADGFLEVTYDATNGTGGIVVLSAYPDKATYPDYLNYREVLTKGGLNAAGTKITKAIPFTRGQKLQLQFDTSSYGGTPAPGAFAFSYAFKTGGGFRLEGAGQFETALNFRESEPAIALTVSRVGSTEGAATVSYELVNEATIYGFTAADTTTDLKAPSDAFSGTLNFAPGESRKTLSFSINDDAVAEGAQAFTFKLISPSAGNVVLDPATLIAIEDNDGAPTNDNFADAIVVPGAAASLTVPSGLATEELGEPARLLQSVWYRWTAPANGVLTLGAIPTNFGELYLSLYKGADLASLVALPHADPFNGGEVYPEGAPTPAFAVESGVTYSIALHGYDSPNTGAITFALNFLSQSTVDPTLAASVFSFSKKSYDVLVGSPTASITIRRKGATDKPASVNFATSLTKTDPEDDGFYDYSPFAEAGVDYVAQTPAAVNFAAGETEKQVVVTLKGDKKKEGTEHFFVRLSAASADSAIAGPAHSPVLIHEGSALPVAHFYYDDFTGALQPQSGPGGEGTILVKLTHSGSFTGTLILDGKKLGFRGALPPLPFSNNGTSPGDSSTTTTHILRTGLPDVVLTLLYAIDDQYNAHLTGTVADGTSTATFAALNPAYFGKYNPQPIVGAFTIILTPDAAVPAAIRQPGFLSLVVKKKGHFALLGGLPDGTKVSGGGTLTYKGTQTVLDQGASYTRENSSFLYDAIFAAPLYKGTGQLTGTMHLGYHTDPAPAPTIGDGTASIRWVHPVMTAGPVLTGFAAPLASYISRFTVQKGELVLPVQPPRNFNLAITGGGLPSITPLGTFTFKGPIAFPIGTSNAPSLKVDAKTGLFTGKFTLSVTGSKPITIQGALSRNRLDATGNFLNGTTAGKVKLDLVP